MWIQIRSMDGKKNVRLDDLSKLTKIEIVRERIAEHFDAEPARQRLFYRGKQLEDGHSLFDYDVGLNEIIQVLIRPPADDSTTDKSTPTCQTNEGEGLSEESPSTMVNMEIEDGSDSITSLYKIGDKIDAKDLKMGAWFEAEIKKISKKSVSNENKCSSSESESSNIIYHVVFDDYEDELIESPECYVRPRARYRLQWEQLVVGQYVMVNYNSDHPNQRGFWYDSTISRKISSPKKLYCKLLLGLVWGPKILSVPLNWVWWLVVVAALLLLTRAWAEGYSNLLVCLSVPSNQLNESVSEEYLIKFHDEVFRIETTPLGNGDSPQGEGEERIKKPDCDFCKDVLTRRCKHCACSICGGKNDPDKQILCDECDMAFHLCCLTPPLDSVPESDDWYCSECKTDTSQVIGAGEKLRMTKKKASMQSNKGRGTTRDWGKGMACVGRSKVCTIVPSNHFGPIPGIPVGTLWKFRVQVSESGVHRPHVAGIHGRENEGSYSIVLSGGYEDDRDNGDEFVYSGSGGRDLSGNRRTAKQSMDQKLTAMNRALARNCDAPINDKNGADSKAWRKGKPVRVVRNHKGSKFSKFCPLEGNRYDGIYKIVKYWPQRNKDGLLVWKYLLRRDDTSPAPWTTEGKKAAKKLGLIMQYPDGYLESQNGSNDKSICDEDETTPMKKGRKRKGQENVTPNLRNKQPRYELTAKQREIMKKDLNNVKLWEEILGLADSTESVGLLSKIEEFFSCVVCQEVVYNPVSTPCGHNICKECLLRSFKADVDSCPNCRFQLGGEYKMEVNSSLQKILLDLFPGYGGGR